MIAHSHSQSRPGPLLTLVPPATTTSASRRPSPPAWLLRTLPQIERVAARLARRLPPPLSAEDLVGAGCVAVLELHRRNPSLPADELERLAISRARGAMLDEMRTADPLSRRTRRRTREVEAVAAEVIARTGRAPADDEIASSLGISRQAVAEAKRVAITRTVPLEDESVAIRATSTAASPEEATHRGQRLARCRTAVARLPERQQRVVTRYFGEDHTLRQIGADLGVTEARVSQILSGAVRDLRTACASLPPPAA